MAQRTLTVRKNADGTVTIRGGRYVESFNLEFKSHWDKYEYIRSAIITAGFTYTEEIEEMVRKEIYSCESATFTPTPRPHYE